MYSIISVGCFVISLSVYSYTFLFVILPPISYSYIYVLFYSEYNTNDFVNTVEYYNPGEAFRQVKKFGNYNFVEINELENENVYLLKNDQYENIKMNPQKYGIQNLEDEFDIKEFAEYTVLQGKEDYE